MDPVLAGADNSSMSAPRPTCLPAVRFVLIALTLSGCGGKSAATSPSMTPSATPAPATLDPGPGLHFTVSPIELSSLIYITSLGAMAPWGHTLPTDHVYFYHHAGNDPYTPVPI